MVKKLIVCILVLFVFLAGCGSSSDNGSGSQAQELYNQAAAQDKTGNYYTAYNYYQMAQQQFINEKNSTMASQSRADKFRVQKITMSYPYDSSQMEALLAEKYTFLSMAVKQGWMDDNLLDCMFMDGKNMYFSGAIDNMLFRYTNYFPEDAPIWPSLNELRTPILAMINNAPPYDDKPYINPIRYLGTFTVNVSRRSFPQKGTLRLWMPFPINTDCQKDIEIVAIEPAEFHVSGPDINADLGNVYFEIPLEKLKGDLDVKVQFKYTSYQQNFTVDPSKVGEYDKTSSLYTTNTASEGNYTITPEIMAKAKEIVGSETNPYLQAQLLYNYVITNIKYSYMPHLAIEQLGIPESVYVHTHGYGDCGSQSMYLSALCRAVGIPARATGGYQVLSEGGAGHFWGEIYLPNYGWVPNDTTIAESLTISPYNNKQDDENIRNFYFGRLDAKRYVIQKSVDLPLNPPASEPRSMTATLQSPNAECPEMFNDPNWVIEDGFKSSIVPVE
ncbi:MAG: transglutaminase domain-containing protein [Firmicutes bacterium]|nr:transglutaminase domain-containing protein [Bacillota bacterium]